MPGLALHTCCAPCAAGAVPEVRSRHGEPVLYWANPNIHPATEYVRRLEAVERFVVAENLALRCEPSFEGLRFVLELGAEEPPFRCEECFRRRLSVTAAWAATEGLGAFTTTLLVSPYQDREAVVRAGASAAEEHGVQFLADDLRDQFRAGQARARGMGLYLQAYCGCLMSEVARYRGRVERALARGVRPRDDG